MVITPQAALALDPHGGKWFGSSPELLAASAWRHTPLPFRTPSLDDGLTSPPILLSRLPRHAKRLLVHADVPAVWTKLCHTRFTGVFSFFSFCSFFFFLFRFFSFFAFVFFFSFFFFFLFFFFAVFFLLFFFFCFFFFWFFFFVLVVFGCRSSAASAIITLLQALGNIDQAIDMVCLSMKAPFLRLDHIVYTLGSLTLCQIYSFAMRTIDPALGRGATDLGARPAPVFGRSDPAAQLARVLSGWAIMVFPVVRSVPSYAQLLRRPIRVHVRQRDCQPVLAKQQTGVGLGLVDQA